MKLAEKITAIEAARKVKSGDHVFIHGASAIPQALVNALAEVSGDLQYEWESASIQTAISASFVIRKQHFLCLVF
ncbi:MAG: hypothetical protein ACKOZV_05825, partial [Bacteroidota bacterium]